MKIQSLLIVIIFFSLKISCMETIPTDVIPLIAQPLNCYDTLNFKLVCKNFNNNSNHLITPEIIKSASPEFRTNMLIQLSHKNHKQLFKLYLESSAQEDNTQNALHALGWDKTIQSTLSLEDYMDAYYGNPGPETIESWDNVFKNSIATKITCSSVTPNKLKDHSHQTAMEWAVANQDVKIIKKLLKKGTFSRSYQLKTYLKKELFYTITTLNRTIKMLSYFSWLAPIAIICYKCHQHGQCATPANNIISSTTLETDQSVSDALNSFDPLID